MRDEHASNGALRDRVVLITGGASGIGRSTALRCAREGARVAVLDRAGDAAAAVADEIRGLGGDALGLATDVSREDDVSGAVESAVARLGPLSGVVTSAGIFFGGDLKLLADVELHDYLHVLGVNLVGTFLAVKHALAHLVATRGAVVTIASTAAIRGHGFGSAYTSSKGGVTALTRLVAVQYGPKGVRANCICPGGVDTPMAAGAWSTPEAIERTKAQVPLQKVAQPEEIASVAAFLLSDDASHVTGQTLTVDGGATIA